MSTIPKITLIGMYNFNNKLFDGLSLPDGIDKQTFIDSLLLSAGEKCVIYTDPDFYKYAIDVWGKKWYHSIDRINKAMTAEYNAIHNFDRYEEWSDESRTSTEARNDTTTSGTANTENKISAYNESFYQPDANTESANRGNVDAHSIANSDGNQIHTGHLFGNIGITTSVQMIEEELNLRASNNIYDVLAKLFARDLLLYIW